MQKREYSIKRMFKASDDVEFYDHFPKSFSYENVVQDPKPF